MVELEPEADGLVPEPTLLYSLSTGEQARRDGGGKERMEKVAQANLLQSQTPPTWGG